MNNREWITDRLPEFGDGINSLVYNSSGDVVLYTTIYVGEAWKPIPECEPYVKPKSWHIESKGDDMYLCHPLRGCMHLMNMRTSSWDHMQAAIRIAAIYEEVMP